MTSTTFEFIDRGKPDSIVLVPGWATDYRVFDSLDLAFNYLVPIRFSPFTFDEALVAALKDNNLNKISLFGWSLGGFSASEFAVRHIHFVDQLILVSIRRKYRQETIEEIKNSLRARKKGYLYKFYAECFCDRGQMLDSKENLFKEYCQELDLDYLLQTLDYLSNVELKPELLQQLQKITIIHGEHDMIAPIQEAIEIKNSVNNARFILVREAGHIPFLEEDFGRYFT